MANIDKLIDRYIASVYNKEDQSVEFLEKIGVQLIYERAYNKGVNASIDILIEMLDGLLYEQDYYIYSREELWDMMKSQLRNHLTKLKTEEQK